MVQTRERLWPRQPEEGETERKEREERERAERRRRAKDRQQKLMEEFASKQKQFMEKAMETGKISNKTTTISSYFQVIMYYINLLC